MDPITLIVFLAASALAVLLYISRQALTTLQKKLSDYRIRYDSLIDVDEELERLTKERDELQAEVNTKRTIIDIDAELGRLTNERDELQVEIETKRTKWTADFEEALTDLEDLNAQLVSTRDAVAMESFGVYEPQFDFDDPEDYKEKLKEVREHQKEMVRDKTAAVCEIEWTVSGSKAKGQTMVNRQLRIMLRAFNGECDAAVRMVRYNNVVSLENRLRRSFLAINKLSESNQCSLVPEYLQLKVDELLVVHELREKQQEIKEEQRAIREQMREEERARRELEKAQREAEQEENRYEEALEKARTEVSEATGAQQDKLQAQIAELEKRLAEAHETKERAVSRAQLTRSGHVYVVSNVGSFGDGIYKIGMTRRLDPNDRVKELGDASVPFRFDVHAMIYSKNAPTLENSLHDAFGERRINLVNTRKEFFRVDLDEIVGVVEQNKTEDVGDVQFTKAAEAEEYRRTLSLIKASKSDDDDSPAVRAKDALTRRSAEWASEL